MENRIEGRGREHVGIVFAQPLVDFQFALRIPLGAFAFIFQFADGPGAVQPLFQQVEHGIVDFIDALAHQGDAV